MWDAQCAPQRLAAEFHLMAFPLIRPVRASVIRGGGGAYYDRNPSKIEKIWDFSAQFYGPKARWSTPEGGRCRCHIVHRAQLLVAHG